MQDIRYASSNNFVGRPLDGYEAPECILRRDVAMALAQVQKDLAAANLGLKVYDCYRPTRAVRTMAIWANDGRAGGATKRFYPKLQKNTLFGSGYIASRSAHSTGTAIDLTLVERAAGAGRRNSIRPRPTAPAPARSKSAAPTTRSTWAPATTAST